jgi:glycosyltransferase involved in cell wall biosynthesis
VSGLDVRGSLTSALTIDLIMGTLGRTVEPRRFLESLAQQTWRGARLIVVDQNPDDRLVRVISEFESDIPILHLQSEVGLSRARNTGLRHVQADVVAFPDDDCWYPPDLLERVTRVLAERPLLGGVHGRDIGRPPGRDDLRPGTMTRYNMWGRVGSYMLFLRRRAVDAVGPFDEMLGLGSPGPWLGGEDLDYVLRCLRSGFWLHYDPTLLVHHPRKRESSSRPDPKDAYTYAMGMGRVLRTGRLPAWFALYMCARGFLGALVELGRARPAHARFYWTAGRGRLRGWLLSPSLGSSDVTRSK